MEIRVDTRQVDQALRTLGTRAADGRVPLGRFYSGFRARVLTAWNHMGPEGGMFRGVFRWPPTADQYTRKTDGQTVPVYGGVPRIQRGFRKARVWASNIATKKTQRRGVSTGERMARTSGNVSGKLRKSNTRWTRKSRQLQDTGSLRDWLLPGRPSHLTKTLLRLGGNVEDWMARLLRRYPMLHFLPEDQAALDQEAQRYLGELTADFNRGGQTRA